MSGRTIGGTIGSHPSGRGWTTLQTVRTDACTKILTAQYRDGKLWIATWTWDTKAKAAGFDIDWEMGTEIITPWSTSRPCTATACEATSPRSKTSSKLRLRVRTRRHVRRSSAQPRECGCSALLAVRGSKPAAEATQSQG